jgi:4-hydroxy-3-polyprenylbenzoate decarboxylase
VKRIIVGISGATGAIYGIRTLEILKEDPNVETHLVLTDAAALTIREETTWKVKDVIALADSYYEVGDIGAPISSGSFRNDGMIIAPCSIKSMSMISNSMNDNLLVRAADVTLKEKRKLVLLVRETPLHLGHLRLMVHLAEMGAVIHPPVPAFYHKPRRLEDIVNHTVGRVLDQFGIEANLFERWGGVDRDEVKGVGQIFHEGKR